MAAFGYVRVSTDRQAEEGESLGAQQRTVGATR
jgi:DNA invertase Pin-like site-specific DNA recombinase